MINLNIKDNLKYLLFFALALILIFLFDSGFFKNKDTQGITINNNNTQMVCSSKVEIYTALNASNLLEKYTYHYPNYQGRAKVLDILDKIPLDSLLCSANQLYDGSEEDKKALMYLIQRKIPLIGKNSRKDIVSYFFYKISQ